MLTQINELLLKIQKPKIKNSIIFFSVLAFSIQALLYISLYSVNVTHEDEWYLVPKLFEPYFNGDPSWVSKLFLQHNEHRLFFPNLIFLANASLTSWNVTVLMYISWALVGVSLVSVYLLLKKNGTDFVWLLIPIAAILYPPIGGWNFLAGFQLQFILCITFFFCSVFFLNSQKNTFFLYSIAQRHAHTS